MSSFNQAAGRMAVRGLIVMMLCGLAFTSASHARGIVVYPFELVDSSDGAIPLADRDARLAELTRLLKAELKQRKLYDVIESETVEAAIAEQLRHADLRTCNGCDAKIAQVAGVDRVMVAWVQMVSNLILNVNIEVRDADSRPILNKSADMRGNTSETWQRALRFMMRSMDQQDQRNR